jgi:hypothetical protein
MVRKGGTMTVGNCGNKCDAVSSIMGIPFGNAAVAWSYDPTQCEVVLSVHCKRPYSQPTDHINIVWPCLRSRELFSVLCTELGIPACTERVIWECKGLRGIGSICSQLGISCSGS